jgi:hypothetical protein
MSKPVITSQTPKLYTEESFIPLTNPIKIKTSNNSSINIITDNNVSKIT